jgi:hypothetical protein
LNSLPEIIEASPDKPAGFIDWVLSGYRTNTVRGICRVSRIIFQPDSVTASKCTSLHASSMTNIELPGATLQPKNQG